MALALGVGALCVAEAVGRLAGPPPVQGFSDLPLAYTRCDPVRGYALVPSATIDYARIRTTLNALGLRGPLPNDGEPTAVLAVGDELTFGWGMTDEQTYPTQLGGLLRERCPSCGVVVNAGVPGYTSYQGLMLVRQLAPLLRPRVVVASFHLNDALLDGRRDAPEVVAAGCRGGALTDTLRRRSSLYGWLAWLVDRPRPDWWSTDVRTPIARYRRNLLGISAEARRVGASVVFLDVGFGGSADTPRGRQDEHLFRRGRYADEYHEEMRGAATLDGMPLVQLIGADLGPNVMLDDVRPNAEGYRRIAARLATTVADHALHE